MAELEIIDAHVHFYRSLALERSNVQVPGRTDRDRWAHPEAVGAHLDRWGISRLVCLHNFPVRQMRAAMLGEIPADLSAGDAAARRAQVETDLLARVRRQNEWLCQAAADEPRLVASVGVHKLFSPEEMANEVRLRVGQGAKVVKMLPGMYYEHPADRAFWPMYQACVDLGVAVISDTGSLGSESGTCYGEPVNFADVLESFPRLRLVMAHFPSAFWDERVELARRFPNLFFDVSGGFGGGHLEVRDGHRALAAEDAARVMRSVGIDRFIFGSDGPRFLLQPALQQVRSLGLADDELALVLAGNARRIYGL